MDKEIKIKHYTIYRKDDNYRIKSKNISMVDGGVWINDDLETGNTDCRLFIPYHNINQIVEYIERINNG